MSANPKKQYYRIAMVCDFFYPRLGGVEMHIWSLSQELLRLGHKVIVITHAYGDRKGVRYMASGASLPLKVYYCPFLPMVDGSTCPTFLVSLPLVRCILIRESIQIVHAHQATSCLSHECLVYGNALGLVTIYTDHSLFAFNDVASVILNRVLQVTLCAIDMAISVSYACGDNLILRAKLDPSRVRVIPNAVDSSKFVPDPSRRSQQHINIVVLSRLVYRKGVDLLVGIIPQILNDAEFLGRLDKDIRFIIAGDGAKMISLQEMVEYHRIQESVEFLGAVAHTQVRDVLTRGDIFLNCSLTESFCIAILEAASCGLLVVSTNVGGVPEVLPSPDMILLSPPTVPAMVKQLKKAILRQHTQEQQDEETTQHCQDEQGKNNNNTSTLCENNENGHKDKCTSSINSSGSDIHSSSINNGSGSNNKNDGNGHTNDTIGVKAAATAPIDPFENHSRIKNMYSWHRVCLETIKVYDEVMTNRERKWRRQRQQQQQQQQEQDQHTKQQRKKTAEIEIFQIQYNRSVPQFLNRLSCYCNSVRGGLGFSSLVVCFILVTFELFLCLVEWCQPKETIDVIPLIFPVPPTELTTTAAAVSSTTNTTTSTSLDVGKNIVPDTNTNANVNDNAN